MGPGSDSDSEWSSLERRQREAYMAGGSRGVAGRRPAPHRKGRKKRGGIPVAPPRIPSFEGAAPPSVPPPLPPYPGESLSEGTTTWGGLLPFPLFCFATLVFLVRRRY